MDAVPARRCAEEQSLNVGIRRWWATMVKPFLQHQRERASRD
jgi:hypothetical protein